MGDEARAAQLQNDPRMAELAAQSQMQQAGYENMLNALQSFGVDQSANKATLNKAFEGARSLSDAQIKEGQRVAALAKLRREGGALAGEKIKATDAAEEAQSKIKNMRDLAVQNAKPVDPEYIKLAKSVNFPIPPGMTMGEFKVS